MNNALIGVLGLVRKLTFNYCEIDDVTSITVELVKKVENGRSWNLDCKILEWDSEIR